MNTCYLRDSLYELMNDTIRKKKPQNGAQVLKVGYLQLDVGSQPIPNLTGFVGFSAFSKVFCNHTFS